MGASRSNRPLNGVIEPVIVTPPSDKQPSDTLTIRSAGSTTSVDHTTTGPSGLIDLLVTKGPNGTSVRQTINDKRIQILANESPQGLLTGQITRTISGIPGGQIDFVDLDHNVTAYQYDADGRRKQQIPVSFDRASEDIEALHETLKAGLDQLRNSAGALPQNGKPPRPTTAPKPL